MFIHNEPENHTIVGWGSIISGACVRIDEYTDDRDNPLERWYDINSDSLNAPITWNELVKITEATATELYILEKKFM